MLVILCTLLFFSTLLALATVSAPYLRRWTGIGTLLGCFFWCWCCRHRSSFFYWCVDKRWKRKKQKDKKKNCDGVETQEKKFRTCTSDRLIITIIFCHNLRFFSYVHPQHWFFSLDASPGLTMTTLTSISSTTQPTQPC